MPSPSVKTLAALSDDLGSFELAAELLGADFVGQQGWREDLHFNTKIRSEPHCDCLAISMPSGGRVFGSDTADGDWIGGTAITSRIDALVKSMRPRTLFIYARRALLTDRFGATFGELLKLLNQYTVSWKGFNLSWFNIPQDAHRVTVIATLNDNTCQDYDRRLQGFLSEQIPDKALINFSSLKRQNVADIIHSRTPRIGMPAPLNNNPYGSSGYCLNGEIFGFHYPIINIPPSYSLLDYLNIKWDMEYPPEVFSARFTSRNGVKGLSLKTNGLAHSFGPSISAWPIFAVDRGNLVHLLKKRELVQWHSTAHGKDIFRLSPTASLALFGPEALRLGEKLDAVAGGSTRKYEVASATIPPCIVQEILQSFDRHLTSS